MSFLSILTTIAGTGMALGYFTQTYKILKRKSAEDVSILTYLIFGIGVTIWLIYGISINNSPIIITNIISVIGAFSVIISYFLHRH